MDASRRSVPVRVRPEACPWSTSGSTPVCPGLIDMHTHLVDRPGDTADLSVFYRRTLEDQVAFGRENARATLMAGFTSVRDVGTYVAWADRALRDEVDAGRTVGPRIQAAGFYRRSRAEAGTSSSRGMPNRRYHRRCAWVWRAARRNSAARPRRQ